LPVWQKSTEKVKTILVLSAQCTGSLDQFMFHPVLFEGSVNFEKENVEDTVIGVYSLCLLQYTGTVLRTQ